MFTPFASRTGRTALGWALLGSWLLSSGACHGATQPSATPIHETFTGMLDTGGTAAFPFTTTNTGNVAVTLVSLDPLSTIAVGIGIGTPSQGACQIAEQNRSVTVGSVLTEALAATTWCVAIFDVGHVTQTVSFAIKVDHF